MPLQGSLGDCYFVAALALLSQHPSVIHTLFDKRTRKYNTKGVYGVRFFEYGQWKTVVVDDYIPCKQVPCPPVLHMCLHIIMFGCIIFLQLFLLCMYFANLHSYTYTHIHIHTYIHTHTHTHAPIKNLHFHGRLASDSVRCMLVPEYPMKLGFQYWYNCSHIVCTCMYLVSVCVHLPYMYVCVCVYVCLMCL